MEGYKNLKVRQDASKNANLSKSSSNHRIRRNLNKKKAVVSLSGRHGGQTVV